jgi:putative Holliday junction resolvase
MTAAGKLIGIDHGIARIGIAVSDGLGISARALTIIIRKSRAEDFLRINQLAEQENVVGLVVGLPISTYEGEEHTRADTVRLWIERFAETTPLPIFAWDEQFTSVDAHQLARHLGRKIDRPIDDLAAQLILQSYLDALHDGLTTPFWKE